jgi:hypothetical protein
LLDNIAQRLGEYLEWEAAELSGERLGAHFGGAGGSVCRTIAAASPVDSGLGCLPVWYTGAGDANVGSDVDLQWFAAACKSGS